VARLRLTIRIIFQNTVPFNHPMHIHEHNMHILDFGVGTYNPSTSLPAANLQNPQRRDTALLPPSGYLVTQIDAENPSVWPFHCFIA
jgi:FtsP/CotA-like multicopper oxidase with cupredoxin domain